MKVSGRPITTLFLLQSLDGKISPGASDDLELDIERVFPRIGGVKEGLHQYYELERQTDAVCFITARVLAKIGVNEQLPSGTKKLPVSFVVVDNKPHLTANGVAVMAAKAEVLYVVTANKRHPAFALAQKHNNIVILDYVDEIDVADAFRRLKKDFDVQRITVQSGGRMNAHLLRADLIDYLHVVIAPCVIGGSETPSLVDGESVRTLAEVVNIKPLRLMENRSLDDSYVALKYEVVRSVVLDETVS